MLFSSGVNSHSYSYRVDVPFLTSHIKHLNASALFLNVQTLQSQYPSSEEGLDCRFGLQTKKQNKTKTLCLMMEKKHEITGTVKIRLYVIFPAQSQSPWNREVSVYTGSCPVLKAAVSRHELFSKRAPSIDRAFCYQTAG